MSRKLSDGKMIGTTALRTHLRDVFRRVARLGKELVVTVEGEPIVVIRPLTEEEKAQYSRAA